MLVSEDTRMRELDRGERAARVVDRVEPRLEAARTKLHEAILEAWRAGASQAVIARVAGLSRERIRQLVARVKQDTPALPGLDDV